MKFSILFIIFISLHVFADDSLWQTAISQFKENKLIEASQSFSQIEAGGMKTSELYSNVALVESHLKRWDKVNVALLKGISLLDSPLERGKWIGQVENVLERMGVRESPLFEWRGYLRALIPKSIWIIGFWMAVWGIILVWVGYGRRKLSKNFNIAGSLLFLFLSGISVQGLLLHQAGTQLAVVTSEEEEVSILAKPNKEENKLISLPRGMVVVSSVSEMNYVKIESPIIGWIENTKLAIIYE